MRNLAVLFIHFIAVLARLLGPGGVRSIVAESLLLKHQLLIVNRSRQRSPNLSASDRIFAGWMALLVRPTRLLRSAIALKPSTLLGLHHAMSKRKYRRLFSPNRRRKSGPKGPSAELIRAVVEMKQHNPNWGCPRIAQQMALAFNIQIDKDVVRRILSHHYRPGQPSGGPSWLTFLGHMKKASGVWICSGASRPRCGPTGSCSSWINTRDGSLASASMRARSMGSHSVGCSTAPFEGIAGCRST
jgi:putative transposase